MQVITHQSALVWTNRREKASENMQTRDKKLTLRQTNKLTLVKPMADGPSFSYEKLVRET